jgi:hypothetical protein
MTNNDQGKNNHQNSTKQGLIIKHSIVWAALMIAIAFLLSGELEDSSIKNTIFIFMVGAWYMSHSLIMHSLGKSLLLNCERRLLKKLHLIK